MTEAEAIAWLEANQGVQLVSSDTGWWAVSLSGFQTISFDERPRENMWFEGMVEPQEWHRSIVEAVQHAKEASEA